MASHSTESHSASSGRSTPSDMTTSSSLGTSPSSSSSHASTSSQTYGFQQQQQQQQQWKRRSSTPTSSFLAPQFWKAAAQGAQSPQPHDAAGAGGGFASLPRRTSFGTAFGAGGGGRLSALSALGMSPSSFSTSLHQVPEWQLQKSHMQQQQQQQQPSSASSSFSDSNVGSGGKIQQSDAVRSGSSTPTPAASQPTSPAPTPKTQARRNVCYLPGPDGLCVESRNRRRSEA
ncbi:hypothetical protein FA10DRAFT_265463 [Acaromyces ingoldii]|uniref:Uncharacterized protein n=1 Tax=Acaromyces ingoldii TaxID=215250 RepID=A0A316YUA5_9BASI|nr:hypothetical protein FA10DRAFT_265463 [Acaromyces ingoldii]PWN91613.1 hypothetical protein FA10DRAFT_265463 [Acaromyces ingoldii]